MLHVLLQPLVGIVARLTREVQLERSLWRQPAIEEPDGQPSADADLRHFLQPGLRDDEDEENAGDDEKDAELLDEAGEVPCLERTEERALPGVQPDLRHRQHAEDDNEADADQADRTAVHEADDFGSYRHTMSPETHSANTAER